MRSKTQNKKVLIHPIIISITILFLITNPIVKSNIKKPDLKIGDKWEYFGWTKEIENVENGTDTYTITITDKKNINIDGKEYLVWEFTYKYKTNPLKLDHKNYHKVSNLSLVKVDWYQVGMWSYFEKSYSKWPIKNDGKKEFNITRIEYDGEKYKTKNRTIVIEYTGNKTIPTKAGTFKCYSIKRYKKNDEENYTKSYYSPEVGWFVKTDNYNENKYVSSSTLTAYETHKGSGGKINEDNKNGFNFGELTDYTIILIILFIILITILIITFFIVRKYKRENKK